MALEVATGTPMANMAETSRRKRRKRDLCQLLQHCSAPQIPWVSPNTPRCLYRFGRCPSASRREHARPEASRFGESHSVAGGVRGDQRARHVASGASVCGERFGPKERPRAQGGNGW